MRNSFVHILPIFTLISYLAAAPYNCNGTYTINPPANITNPWFYPATWTDKDSPPQYTGGQNCSWTINVPKGMFAYFALKADTNKKAVLQMTDSIGYVTTFDTAAMDPFYLMDPSFKVELRATDVGSLGLRVMWYPIGTFYPETIKLSANSTPITRVSGDFDNGTVIEATTKVSILSIPPATTAPDLIPYMRATQVFDGPNRNSSFLGNLWQVMATGNNLLSSGKFLTLYSLFPGFNIGNFVILQDYSGQNLIVFVKKKTIWILDVKDFKQYKAIQCIFPNLCQVSLNATQGKAAAIRFSGVPFYVKEISCPQTNKLSVYTDFVTDGHKLAEYSSDNVKTNIPQIFKSRFTTFVLNKDEALIQFSSDRTDAKWANSFIGRRGFVSSPNYLLSSQSQNFDDLIGNNGRFNITYKVDNTGIVDNATFTVRIFDGNKAVVDETYSTKNFPGGPVSSVGNSISVKYSSPASNSTGAFVSFAFDEHKSANNFGILGTIIIAIWIALFS
uniref:CUB_2 domain-containing protein n=1 Tax=Caenorhabditis japonica TaxID=281687 RepID=A0A8R1I1E9_CAEJA